MAASAILYVNHFALIQVSSCLPGFLSCSVNANPHLGKYIWLYCSFIAILGVVQMVKTAPPILMAGAEPVQRCPRVHRVQVTVATAGWTDESRHPLIVNTCSSTSFYTHLAEEMAGKKLTNRWNDIFCISEQNDPR